MHMRKSSGWSYVLEVRISESIVIKKVPVADFLNFHWLQNFVLKHHNEKKYDLRLKKKNA